jgi:hypothetical protein
MLLCLARVGLSQETPRYQAFGGFSYLRVHASGAEDDQVVGLPDFMLQQRNVNFNLYGWDTTFTENVSRWFGADLDVSGNYGSPFPSFLCSASSVSNALSCLSSTPVRTAIYTKLHTYTIGPRFSLRRYGRVVPFAHVLAGAGHISGTINHSAIFVPIPTLLPQNTSQSNTALTVIAGAGIDINVNSRVSIRAFELDYLMTRFYNQRQDNGRASFGMVFNFGHS